MGGLHWGPVHCWGLGVNAGGTLTTFIWDGDARLVVAETPGGGPVTFSYDPDGLRQRREGSSGSVDTLWDGENLLAEIGGGGTQASYTAGLDKFGPLVSQRRSGTSRFYLADEIGTVHGLLDSSQSLTDSYVFGAFGDPVSSSGSTTNPHRFVGGLGYYEDPDLDLTYVRARWYRPSTGTWLSVDPIAGEPPFSYVGHAPTFRTDPSGEAWYWWLLFLWMLAKATCVATWFVKGERSYPQWPHDRVHLWAYCWAARYCGILGIGDWIYYATEAMQEALKLVGVHKGDWRRDDVARNMCGARLEKLRRDPHNLVSCYHCSRDPTATDQGGGHFRIVYARVVGQCRPTNSVCEVRV